MVQVYEKDIERILKLLTITKDYVQLHPDYRNESRELISRIVEAKKGYPCDAKR